jgi:hypothetical protein
MPANGLEVLTIDKDVVSLPASASRIIITRANDEPLDMRHWTFALDLVSKGIDPPVEYPLLTTARRAIRLQQFRRAVIDASTATELALTHLLDANFAGLPSGIQRQLRSNRAMLGWLIETVASTRRLPPAVLAIRGHLPTNLKADLVGVRNEVIHKNKQPTRAEAAEAVRLAREMVRLIKPLPSPPP